MAQVSGAQDQAKTHTHSSVPHSHAAIAQTCREAVREKKAEKAARLTKSIEAELLSRLNDTEADVYGGIYNFPEKEFETVVDKHGEEQEMDDGDEEEELEQEMDNDIYNMFVADYSDDDGDLEDFGGVFQGGDEEEEELDQLLKQLAEARKRKAHITSDNSVNDDGNKDDNPGARKKKKKKRRPHVEIEIEGESNTLKNF